MSKNRILAEAYDQLDIELPVIEDRGARLSESIQRGCERTARYVEIVEASGVLVTPAPETIPARPALGEKL